MGFPKDIKEFKKRAEKPRTKIGDLSLGDILAKHIDRIMHCFTWVNHYTSAQDYEQNVQILEASIIATESFISPNLDKEYWKTKKKIMTAEPESFEEVYSETLKNMDLDDPYNQDEVGNMRAIHFLKHKVLQLNILFRELMRWIDQSELGFPEVSDTIVGR